MRTLELTASNQEAKRPISPPTGFKLEDCRPETWYYSLMTKATLLCRETGVHRRVSDFWLSMWPCLRIRTAGLRELLQPGKQVSKKHRRLAHMTVGLPALSKLEQLASMHFPSLQATLACLPVARRCFISKPAYRLRDVASSVIS